MTSPHPKAWANAPKDWKRLPAKAVCSEIVVGIVVKPTQYYRPEGVPVFRSANVREAGIDPSDLVFMSAEDNAKLGKSQVHAGDVLTVRTGYPGTSCVVPESINGANCVDIIISRPNQGVLPNYYSRWLNSDFGKGQVLRNQGGLAQQHFNVGELAQLTLLLPPVGEQARIAEVLDTLDEAIRGTESVVQKLEVSRQGLLRDLLTLGVDKAGNVRSKEDRSAFQDSPLGPLPRSWSVSSLQGLLDQSIEPSMRSGPFGSELLKKDLVEEGVPLIGIDNIEVEYFVPNFTRFVTPWKFADISRYRSYPQDVLITIMGTVGRCCLVPDSIGDALTTKHVWALSLDRDHYSPLLACLQINYAPWVLRHLDRDQQGGIMSAIRADTLRSIMLPVPPREELDAIESIIRSLGDELACEKERAHKLRVIKSGLSSDLLSGRIRTRLQ